MNVIFCTDCGNSMKEIRKKTQYRADNGEVMGYWITFRCSSATIFQKLFRHWDIIRFVGA